MEWRGAGSYRSGARYYGEETAGGGGSWQQEAARSPWRPAHYQPQLILTHTPSPHRRSATDPNISAVLRPPPPRRRLPPTPQQPSNLNIDQFNPMTMSRSPTAPGYLASSNTSILPNTELSINFPKLNASPTHKSLGEFRAPPGMIPSTLPRPPAPGRRTLPAPIPGWAGLEEAVAAGRGTRQLPVVAQQPRPGVGHSPTRGHRPLHSEDEEEDWC